MIRFFFFHNTQNNLSLRNYKRQKLCETAQEQDKTNDR